MELRPVYAWLNTTGEVSVSDDNAPVDFQDWDCVTFSLDDVPDLIEDLTRLIEDLTRLMEDNAE